MNFALIVFATIVSIPLNDNQIDGWVDFPSDNENYPNRLTESDLSDYSLSRPIIMSDREITRWQHSSIFPQPRPRP